MQQAEVIDSKKHIKRIDGTNSGSLRYAAASGAQRVRGGDLDESVEADDDDEDEDYDENQIDEEEDEDDEDDEEEDDEDEAEDDEDEDMCDES